VDSSPCDRTVTALAGLCLRSYTGIRRKSTKTLAKTIKAESSKVHGIPTCAKATGLPSLRIVNKCLGVD
ncbi:MAG TPA: hypothetical protein VN278_04305, partial [Methanosarcina sp.]|nr:hypothetical protein [Methanosarcina sp.]